MHRNLKQVLKGFNSQETLITGARSRFVIIFKMVEEKSKKLTKLQATKLIRSGVFVRGVQSVLLV